MKPGFVSVLRFMMRCGMIKPIAVKEGGKIDLTFAELECLIEQSYNEGYNEGYKDGKNKYVYYPVTTTPATIPSKPYITWEDDPKKKSDCWKITCKTGDDINGR